MGCMRGGVHLNITNSPLARRHQTYVGMCMEAGGVVMAAFRMAAGGRGEGEGEGDASAQAKVCSRHAACSVRPCALQVHPAHVRRHQLLGALRAWEAAGQGQLWQDVPGHPQGNGQGVRCQGGHAPALLQEPRRAGLATPCFQGTDGGSSVPWPLGLTFSVCWLCCC